MCGVLNKQLVDNIKLNKTALKDLEMLGKEVNKQKIEIENLKKSVAREQSEKSALQNALNKQMAANNDIQIKLADKEFSVKKFQEMQEEIRQLKEENKFYSNWATLGRQVSEEHNYQNK